MEVHGWKELPNPFQQFLRKLADPWAHGDIPQARPSCVSGSEDGMGGSTSAASL